MEVLLLFLFLACADKKAIGSTIQYNTSSLKFNPTKCEALVIGQKMQDRRWCLGRDRIQEVDSLFREMDGRHHCATP